ncbi:hypothetical protein POM88_004804 [Heracleum sosnowskyi]|uniref:Aluminum resistance protein n=1 Tax=Heracleum sosnowskyi TaxID=360622 RepID=A0AAD8NCV9_9APIA|nr:hypothetical protein POM88_004804 [Heracleum sosnowskyi]
MIIPFLSHSIPSSFHSLMHSIPSSFHSCEVNGALEFRGLDNLVARNTAHVLKAFQNARVSSHHFGGCTGYGHEEAGGREALDQCFAEIFGAESALVRSQFFSGTHAITCALFALLRPGDELLAVAGAPYDTLEEVIGVRDSNGLGSLRDFGVEYREVPLAEDGGLDWNALNVALKPQTKCALIQRSCGYSWRRSLSVNEIGRAIKMIKMQNPKCLVMVDNCYGEFVELIEPPMVGADLIAGSLIKNPVGTIAPCGGYVAGQEKLVKAAAARLSAPGLGIDCGSTPGDIMRALFQGLYLSPQMVGEALKGSLLIAEVMAMKGYKVQPLPRVTRHDTAVQLGSREVLLVFCEAVQRSSPVGSFTKPVAGATPGYASEGRYSLDPVWTSSRGSFEVYMTRFEVLGWCNSSRKFCSSKSLSYVKHGAISVTIEIWVQEEGGTHWTQWGLVLGFGDMLALLWKLTIYGKSHFGGCTGYGHEEAGGREALDQCFAEIFGAESALVRSQFFSGTHAITCALFALLRPVAGAPYDTLEEVIGVRDSNGLGSLRDFGVEYREVPLAEDGCLDWNALNVALKPQTKCALIQRSCGYSWRRSLSVNEIGRAIKMIKMQNPKCLVMVDNCYGEFVELIEPPMVGADLIAGSLIKNPGGTIALCTLNMERTTKASVLLIYNMSMTLHKDSVYHEENPDRITSIWAGLYKFFNRCVVMDTAPEVAEDTIALVHTKQHIEYIKSVGSMTNESSLCEGENTHDSHFVSKRDVVLYLFSPPTTGIATPGLAGF